MTVHETLDELRARLNALAAVATARPWFARKAGLDLHGWDVGWQVLYGSVAARKGNEPLGTYGFTEPNATFIAAIVNAWPAIDALLARLTAAEAVLELYADPDSYFAVAIWSDPPAGWFADDYGPEDEFPDYERPMFGKAARDYFQEHS